MRRSGRTAWVGSLAIMLMIVGLAPLRGFAAPAGGPPPLGAKGQTAAASPATTLARPDSTASVREVGQVPDERLLGAKGQTAQAHQGLRHVRADRGLPPPVWPPAQIRRAERGAGGAEAVWNRPEPPVCATTSGPRPSSRLLGRRLARTAVAPLILLPRILDPSVQGGPSRLGSAPGFGVCYAPGVLPSALLQRWSC